MNGCICVDSGELGVALSGGGARALAQVGVLKVLEREKIPVSHVAGTSAGAVIGAVFATSESAREAEARVLAHRKTTGVGFNAETFATLSSERPRSYTRLWDLARRIWRMRRAGGALIGGEEMRNSLRVLLRGVSFEATRLPFATTALDPGTGRRMIFAAGSLVDGVYASSAIPGLVEPLALGEYLRLGGAGARQHLSPPRRHSHPGGGRGDPAPARARGQRRGHGNPRRRAGSRSAGAGPAARSGLRVTCARRAAGLRRLLRAPARHGSGRAGG